MDKLPVVKLVKLERGRVRLHIRRNEKEFSDKDFSIKSEINQGRVVFNVDFTGVIVEIEKVFRDKFIVVGHVDQENSLSLA